MLVSAKKKKKKGMQWIF